jgi:hypothetical protein
VVGDAIGAVGGAMTSGAVGGALTEGSEDPVGRDDESGGVEEPADSRAPGASSSGSVVPRSAGPVTDVPSVRTIAELNAAPTEPARVAPDPAEARPVAAPGPPEVRPAVVTPALVAPALVTPVLVTPALVTPVLVTPVLVAPGLVAPSPATAAGFDSLAGVLIEVGPA